MILFGGTGFPFGQATGDSVHVCDLKTLVWTRLKTTGDPLMGLYGSVIILINPRVSRK